MKKWLGTVMTMAVVGILIGTVIIPAIAQGGGDADIPTSISYQGFLTDKTSGDPIDTPVDITFTLYTELSSGTPVWAEVHTGVLPDNGLFSVELGGNGSPMQASVFDGDRYLGVKVGIDEEMTQRQKMTSVAFALVAEMANTSNSAYTLNAPDGNPENAVYVDNDGNVGIGTGTPTADLEIGSVGPTAINASVPIIEGTRDTSGEARAVYVSGNYAYVADMYSGMHIIDISDPSDPEIEGTYLTLSAAYDVHVSGKYAYIATREAGLQIIDVSDPTSPSLVATHDTWFAEGIYLSGKYAYLADSDEGLKIIDISDPINPTLEGTYATGGYSSEVYVSGKFAYVTTASTNDLRIVDISNPSSPSFEGTYAMPDSAHGVYVSGKYAYVAVESAGMLIIDVSDPSNPSLEQTFSTSGEAWDIYVSGNYAYVADGNSGLQVIDISDPDSPSLEGTCATSTSAIGVYVCGKYAYVADWTSGLQIVDISGISTPAISTGNIETSDITVTENADIGNNLYVRNGVNVGPGGLYVDAGNGIATDSDLTVMGSVGIGLVTPNTNYKLQVEAGSETAVYAVSADNDGIHGISSGVSDAGVSGQGNTANSWGVSGYNGYGGIAVRGSSSGWAGYFLGNTHISNSLAIGSTVANEKIHIREKSTTLGAAALFDSTGGSDGRQFWVGSTLSGNIGGAGLFQIYDDTANAARLNIDAAGDVGIGTTNPTYTLDVQDSSTSAVAEFVNTANSTATSKEILRLQFSGDSVIDTNEDFIQFLDSVGEVGRIHSEVQYGTFTGGHEGQSADDPITWKPGMIVISTGNTISKQMARALVEITLASQNCDPRVMGVYLAHRDEHEVSGFDPSRPAINYNAVGEGLILVTDFNGEISNGDYVTSSEITGYGMKQNDDLLHNYTVAKVTEEIDWNSITETIEYDGHIYKITLAAATYHCG